MAPMNGGETNWLQSCTDGQSCAQGKCVCGVCTTSCEASSACNGAFRGACFAEDSSIVASACDLADDSTNAGVCLPSCGDDDECGRGFRCREGVCVTSAIVQHMESEPLIGSDRPADAGPSRAGSGGVTPPFGGRGGVGGLLPAPPRGGIDDSFWFSGSGEPVGGAAGSISVPSMCPFDHEPLTGDPPYQDPASENDCKQTVDEFCETHALPCPRTWAEAQLGASWCDVGSDAFLTLPACHGTHRISFFTHCDEFLVYYYDEGTKELTHVSAIPVPSESSCLGGELDTPFDGSGGCQDQLIGGANGGDSVSLCN